jgi:hypothetical protein
LFYFYYPNLYILFSAYQSLLDVLSIFQLGNSHLALVSEEPEQLQKFLLDSKDNLCSPPPVNIAPIGILSIEDIIEEMIQSKVYVEEDTTMPDTEMVFFSI